MINIKIFKCISCDSVDCSLSVCAEPKEISLICNKCGLNQTVLSYNLDSTYVDIADVDNAVSLSAVTSKSNDIKLHCYHINMSNGLWDGYFVNKNLFDDD